MTKSSRRPGTSQKLGKFEHLEARWLMALTTELAYDLETTPGPAAVESLTVLGDAAYFLSGDTLWKTNEDGTSTTEVKDFSGTDSFPYGKRMLLAGDRFFLFGKAGFWVSDGTDTGTIRIRDEFQPLVSEGFSRNADVNGTLFFVVRGATDLELWKSDGTAAGTARIPFYGDAPTPVTAIGGKLVFTQKVDSSNLETWATDGSEAGTVLLPIPTSDSPLGKKGDYAKLGDKLLVSVSDHIWETDGTVAGTRDVQDVNPSRVDPPIELIGSAGSFAYFLGEGTDGWDALWRTDGSPDGATLIRDFGRDVNIATSVAFGRRIAIAFRTAGEGVWVSDGTAEGTAPIPQSHFRDAPLLTAVENEVFIANVDDDGTSRIWKTDGTPEGTLLLRTYDPSTYILDAVALNGAYLFDDGQLRRSDGTPEGTGGIIHVNRNTLGSSGSTPLGFVATETFLLTIADRQLWSFTDPNAAPVKIWQGAAGDSLPPPGGLANNDIFTTEDKAYFIIRDSDPVTSERRNQLWVTGGTLETTHVLHNFGVNPGFQHRLAANGLVYFNDSDSELWVTQGVPGTTQRILEADFFNQPMFESAIAAGNRVYFDGHGEALWVTEGTPETTRLVYDFPNEVFPPTDFAELNGVIYFNAPLKSDPGDYHTTRLFCTDGTTEGTRSFFPPESLVAWDAKSLVRVEDRIYFRASHNGWYGLFVTDGTVENTRVIVDRVPSDTLDEGRFVVIGSRLFFRGFDGELNVTEGTTESTLTLTIADRDTRNYTVSNGLLFFQQADDQDTSLDRWRRTDGTLVGTFPVTEPGEWSAVLTATAAGNVFFARVEPSNGMIEGELWKSDGTLEGTTVAAPLMSYLHSRGIWWPLAASLRGDVYYGNSDLRYGYEPWRVRAPDGDVNFDGEVNLEDLNHVRNQFGYEGRDRPGDANGDGVVGLDDLNEVRNNFGGASSLSSQANVPPAQRSEQHDMVRAQARRDSDPTELDELLYVLAEDHARISRRLVAPQRAVRGARRL